MNETQATDSSYIVHTDGGSRGNPGHGAIGIVIARSNDPDKPIETISRYLGSRVTNNEAEYQAVIVALEALQRYVPNTVVFYLDSELVVKQLQGIYKVKKQHLKPFYQRIQALSKTIPVLKFNHVPRSENAHADALVNEALDAISAK